jgi:hypothetical protein
VEPSKIDVNSRGIRERPTQASLNDSLGPRDSIHKVKSSAKMGSSEPIIEVSPPGHKSSMMLHEESSNTETNDGVSNMAMLDGNTVDNKEGLFKFKKVKGFKQKTQKLDRKESSRSHLQDEIVFSNLKVLPGDIKGGNKLQTQIRRKGKVPVVTEEPVELIFNTDMKISQKLISKLEDMKKFPINNSELAQQYI